MWTSESNTSIYPQFISELGKLQSKGSFHNDYLECCRLQRLIPCPFITIEEVEESVYICKLMNCIIDSGSWRAMLVACSTIGNSIIEIYLHNVRVTSHFIDDLSQLFKSNETTIQCLKLEYLDISGDVNLFVTSLKNLISNSTGLRYLSLSGLGLTDQHLSELLLPIRNHFTLEGLNLYYNQITDIGFQLIVNILPFAIHLNSISLKHNRLTGQSLQTLLQLYFGYNINGNHEIENEIKAITKLINDRNKSIKDYNRKLKKDTSNNKLLYELSDLEQLNNRIIKTSDGQNLVYNYSLRLIDLSRNENITNEDLLSFQSNLLNILHSGQCHILNRPHSPSQHHEKESKDGHEDSRDDHGVKVLTLCLRGLGTNEIHERIQNENYNGLINIVF